MKISSILKEYFSFNRKEQRGVFLLLFILTGLIVSDIFISDVMPKKQVDFSGFAKEVEEFEKELNLRDSIEKMTKNRKYPGRTTHFANGQIDSSRRSYPQVKELFVIELNAADTFELQRLRGIGPSFAKRIVKYRERLGGYLAKSQLLEVFGMDNEKFNEIKDHLTVNPDSIRKINLNVVTFKELLSHPYFPFEVTKNIMIYRKEHKKFLNTEELLMIKSINDSIYVKIKPYVKAE